MPVTLATRALDIGVLAVMAFLPTDSAAAVAAFVGLHLVRKAVANCTRPLMRSVLMDHVAKRHRWGATHPAAQDYPRRPETNQTL